MATPIEGVDYSFSRPGGVALARAGKRFAIRYVPYRMSLDPETWTGKGLNVAELSDLLRNGLTVGMVFETTARRPLDGWSAGVYDARLTVDGLAHCGLPASLPVYFAVDFDAYTTYHMGRIDQYLRGAASVLGASRIGVYGGVKVIEHCARAGTAKWLWQTYAWSYGQVSSYSHLLQYDNGEKINGQYVDFCRALRPDFGQFPRPGTRAPGLPDTSVTEEDDMYALWVPRMLPRSGKIYLPAGSNFYGHPFLSKALRLGTTSADVVLDMAFAVSGDPHLGSRRWFGWVTRNGGPGMVPENTEGLRVVVDPD